MAIPPWCRVTGIVTVAAALAAVAIPARADDLSLVVSRPENAGRFEVTVNQAIVVNSTTPFAEISVAEPSIADVAGISASSLYVIGKSPGRTTLTLLGEDGVLLVHAVIEVTEPRPEEPKSVRVRRGGEVSVHTVEPVE